MNSCGMVYGMYGTQCMVLNDPFETIRTQWNSSPHLSNQNHNGKISKEVPAKFKIHCTYYSIFSYGQI